MAINKIQFQEGLSLEQFLKDYGCEEQCESALIDAKWSNGYCCSRCSGNKAIVFKRGKTRYWECNACHCQTSLIAGTMLQQTQLPLTKWFLAMYLMTQSKTNIAALALMRQLGVSWKTAWLLKHKLMEVMHQREAGHPLEGDVRIDDAYLGGEQTGGKVGRGSENKVPFVAAVEMKDNRPQRVRFDPVDDFSFASLKLWAARALMPGCTVTSDGLPGFGILGQMGFEHHVVLAGQGKRGCEAPPFRWLNVLLGNLKTTLSGTHHAFKFSKYAHRYLAEIQYRFNRRFDLGSIIPRLTFAIMRTKPCPKPKILMKTEDST
jgi:ribosomal protein L37AE/L43A